MNFGRAIYESDTLPPLDDGSGRESDHSVAYFKARHSIAREKRITYKYRHYSEEGAASFQAWIADHNFRGSTWRVM